MKLFWATGLLLLGSTGVASLTIPSESSTLVERDDAHVYGEFLDLEKRRGGGGGGRSGSSSSGGSSGGRSGSSSSSSGSSRGGSSSGSSGSRSGSSSSSSGNRGGSTSSGSGTRASYGGGRYDSSSSSSSTHDGFNSYDSYGSSHWPWIVTANYTSGASRTVQTPRYPKTKTKTIDRYYAGGARTPYTAGSRSPLGITPFVLPVAALAFFPGVWLYGAYAYPYHHPYYYEDETNHHNESIPVVCVCQEYQECGCDDNNNSTYYESLFNGTQPRNTSNTRVVEVNGTEKIYINGTLANGTTAADGSSSGASASVKTLLHASGYWVTVAVVATAVWVF